MKSTGAFTVKQIHPFGYEIKLAAVQSATLHVVYNGSGLMTVYTVRCGRQDAQFSLPVNGSGETKIREEIELLPWTMGKFAVGRNLAETVAAINQARKAMLKAG